LKFKPYRISAVHELKPLDYGKRVAYCQWFQEFIKIDGILNLAFFTDEAWFHLSGYVNSQNYRIWATENPHEFRETSLHPQKIGVWCAVSRKRIVGPIFFTDTINSDNYVKILEQFVSELEEEEIVAGHFQQDGAPAHTAKNTAPYLKTYFANRIISKSNRYLETEVEWPTRSPDLTILDFFLWGHLKNRVYATGPQTLDELKANIENEIRNISSETLIRVSDNMIRRVELCLENGGGHFQHLL